MQLFTAKPNYQGSDVLDISASESHVMPAGRCLAPTVKLEKDLRSGAITAEEFHQQYLQLIRARYSKNKNAFCWLLMASRLTLTCDNHKTGVCHCQDAVKILQAIADAYDLDVFYCGERETSKSKPNYHDRVPAWDEVPHGAEF